MPKTFNESLSFHLRVMPTLSKISVLMQRLLFEMNGYDSGTNKDTPPPGLFERIL